MSITHVYRVETESGDGMYADDIGILNSSGSKENFTPYRPFPSEEISKHLRKAADKKDFLFGFKNKEQVIKWIKNPEDFEFLSKNFKVSVYQVPHSDIIADDNQLVYFQPKSKLIKRLSLLDF